MAGKEGLALSVLTCQAALLAMGTQRKGAPCPGVCIAGLCRGSRPICYNLFVTLRSVLVVFSCVRDLRTRAEWRKLWVPHCVCSQLRSRVSSHPVHKCRVHNLFSAPFFTCLCFVLVMPPFKTAPSVVLNCCLVFSAQGGCDVPGRENMSVRRALFHHV